MTHPSTTRDLGSLAARVMGGALSPRTRLALEAMLGCGSALYVYVGVDGTEDGTPLEPWHPKPGSGAILHDCVDAPCPLRVGRRIVQRLRALGVRWHNEIRAETVHPEDRARLDALLSGRDVLWIAPSIAATARREAEVAT